MVNPMKLWFQQNRALGTLLIVFGIGALFAGTLLYWRWATWSDARQTFDQAAAERTRLQQLDPFPNDANYRKSQGYLDRYSTALNKFKDELKNGVVPAPPLAPNEFQSRLRLATVATVNRAQTNNVKLPDKFELGFDEFATGLPDTTVAPLLGQELSQVQMLMNILLDAKVDSVISLHRAPLPEERKSLSTRTPSPAAGRTATKTGTPPPTALQRNVVDVTFKATPAAARKVLNEIANSSGQFFIIRTLYVHNEKDKGPPRQRTEPTPPQAPQTTSPQPGAAAPLSFIVGNEHIEVSATIEMLRFGS
ncbi:MAG: hypothetical protein DMF38_11375 [Verrucomicrobia bacterium]|nr:MAG: hypothetical protein DMF38_11375 [Verrucomicrobiota bacterium]